MGEQWIEVRSTAVGMLDALPSSQDPPGDAPRIEGVVSVVITQPQLGRRRLPGLYLGPSQTFASRDVEELVARLNLTVDRVLASLEVSTYCAQPCEVNGRRGLFARELFNRTGYRRKLERRGVTFSADPYPRFVSGRFVAADYGEFVPEFLILSEEEDAEDVAVVSTAAAVFALSAYRIGKVITPVELSELTSLLRSMRCLTSPSPDALVDALLGS